MSIQSVQRELQEHTEVDSLRTAICAATTSVCLNAFGNRLRGIVLSGSLARHEATFVWNSGQWDALGDAEFFIIFKEECQLPQRVCTELIRQEVERALIDQGICCHIELSPVYPKYLSRLRPHILAYELKECGQVIWGDSQLLGLIPRFSASDIFLEDAWRLLANRMIEQLEVLATEEISSPKAQYRTVKLWLDMATSYLVFVGRYAPTYRGRESELKYLAEDSHPRTAAPLPLQAFAHKVTDCTRFKLEGKALPIPTEELLREAIRFAQLLWTWELMQLTGCTRQISSTELMLRWMTQQPVHARIRGWASVLRRCGWYRSCREWPRWALLGWRGSPRHWVYSVATEVLFNFPLDDLKLERTSIKSRIEGRHLLRRLPVLAEASAQAGIPPWQWAARVSALNYRKLLESTTA